MDILDLQKWAYIEGLPSQDATVCELFQRYSGISPDEIENHLLHIVSQPVSRLCVRATLMSCPSSQRKHAWAVSRHPFIGRWRFLQLADQLDPYYQQVLFRLKLPNSTDSILDVGCGFGQALRQLRASGVAGKRLFGADIEPRFVELGYDLFRDAGKLGATFVVGDLLDPDDGRLDALAGRFTIIHADSFFHLLSWTRQMYVAKRLVSWLRPGARNTFIYGKHIGTMSASEETVADNQPFVHSPETFQKLWDEVGLLTKTRWKVDVEVIQDTLELPIIARDLVPVRFAIYQIS